MIEFECPDIESLSSLRQKILNRDTISTSDTSELLEEHEMLCELFLSLDLNKLDRVIVRDALSQDELDQILDSHEKWLLGKKGGKCADLQDKDLSYLDLSNRDLSYIDFSRSLLDYADLRNANALRCKFIDASLNNTRVIDACFYQSDFRFANLSGFYPQGISFYGAYGVESQIVINGESHPMTQNEISVMKERIKDAEAGHNIKEKQKSMFIESFR